MDAFGETRGFAGQVALVLVVGLVLGAYPVYHLGGWGPLSAALAGCGISTANVLVGVVSIVWSFDKPQPVFLKVILGGMAARMMAVCVTLLLVVKLTNLAIFPLVGSMFGFYLIFQVLEVMFVVKHGQNQKGV